MRKLSRAASFAALAAAAFGLCRSTGAVEGGGAAVEPKASVSNDTESSPGADPGVGVIVSRLSPELHFQTSASFLTSSPGAKGVELGVQMLIEPISNRWWYIGPRFALAFFGTDRGGRWNANTGLESTLWMANWAGPGIGVDLVAPSREVETWNNPHVRLESFLGIRLRRYGEEGALALRLGVQYDTRFRWGARIGVTLQFSGVHTPSLLPEPSSR